ncbi:acyl carrier protein [Methylobacterium sp. NMS12]|uniref:acyl carrier protein n=1 Tax=Methylobacterium sp. NMS12 TaxID=3079766 RepID=UPI003F883DD8
MADLLGFPAKRLGAAGDFFAAGGNSLLVIKLTARIRKLLKVEIPRAWSSTTARPRPWRRRSAPTLRRRRSRRRRACAWNSPA